MEAQATLHVTRAIFCIKSIPGQLRIPYQLQKHYFSSMVNKSSIFFAMTTKSIS